MVEKIHKDTGVPVGANATSFDFVELNEDGYPEYSLIGMLKNGSVYKYNLQTGKSDIIIPNLPGQPTEIQTIKKGPDGKIYSSGYLSGGLGVYSPTTGEHVQYKEMGQAEGITSYGSKMYFGIYPGANIYEYDTAKPWTPKGESANPKKIFTLSNEDQDRPFAMLAVEQEKKMFMGTVPAYGKRGGALSVYDFETGSVEVNRNVVQDHSINALAYKDGLIYGGTSAWGGLGIDPLNEDAKLFVWDVAQKKKVLEIVPAPGERAITGLITAKDGNIWGIAEGTLFIFDPVKREIVYRAAKFNVDYTGYATAWRDAFLETGNDGNIYGTVGGNFFTIDLATKAVTTIKGGNTKLFTQDNSGNFYFTSNKSELVQYTNGTLMPPTGIKLDNKSLNLNIGETKSLKATVTPENIGNKNVLWSSSNESAAVVDGTGKITAKAVGKAVIKATTEVGKLEATCEVIVTAGNSELLNTIFQAPIDLGAPIQSIGITDSEYGVEDGVSVMYTTLNGNPAYFNVIDIENNKLLRSFPLEGGSGSWSHTVDKNGNVYIAVTGGKLFKYSPVSKNVEDLGTIIAGETAIYGLSSDEQGNVYGGTFPRGKVFKYDAASKSFRDYGSMVEGQQYVRGSAYHNGFVYAGIGSKGSLIKLNVQTGEKTDFVIPARANYDVNNLPFIYDLNVVRDYLFVHISGTVNCLLVYDLKNKKWLEETYTGYKGLYVSPEYNGKSFFAANGKIMEFDLATTKVTDTGIAFGTFLRHSGWAQVKNDPELPGMNLVTMQYGGNVTYFNLETKKVKAMQPVVEGQPIDIQSLEMGPDGKLYISGYMGTTGVQYNPSTGARVNFNLGQSEGMGILGNKIYMGNYPGAIIHELDTTKPLKDKENPKQIYDMEEEQDRPFAITSGDNKLFVGTIPEYGHLGGVLGIYSPDKNEWSINRNVVQDQSVIGIAYKDGKVYGSTSVWGGLGSTPTQEEAKMFVWDVEKGEKIKEFTPVIPGINVKLKAIGGLSFGPDGLLWGASRGILFALNPDTLEVVKSREVYPTDWNVGHYWRPVYLKWGNDGLLYTTLNGKVTVVNPQTLEHKTLSDSSLMTLGKDGSIYYAYGSRMYKIGVSTYPLSEVNISLDNLEIERTKTSKLNVSGKLANGGAANLTAANIQYFSSKPEIASVNEIGIITANKEGSVEISAVVTLDGKVVESNKLTVTVKYLKMDAVALELVKDINIADINSEVKITLKAKDAKDLYGFDVYFNYNAEHFEFKAVSLSKEFGVDGQDASIDKQESNGSVRIIGTKLGNAAGLNGEAPVVNIVLKAKDKHVKSEFAIAKGGALTDSKGALYILPEDVKGDIAIANADVNGGGIAKSDLVHVIKAFGSRKGTKGYSETLDMNLDEKIDIIDISYVAMKVFEK